MKFEESEKANEKLKIEKKERREKMIKKLKKAFTITELVIVIAVIAILAAVLIPTFTSLIDKANQSSDISAVRDMNLALKNAEAAGNKPEGASQAMDILEEANLDARGYKALAGDHVIYYNLDLNAVLYMYIGEDGYVVEFPEEYKDVSFYDESYTGKWFDLSARMAGDETWKNAAQVSVTDLSSLLVTTAPNEGEEVAETATTSAVIMDGDKIVGAKVDTAAKLVSVVEYIETLEDEGEGFTLVLGDDVDLMNSEWKPISEYRGNFYGNYHTIDNMQITDITAEAEPYSAKTQATSYYYYGFISVFSGKEFKNVTFNNVKIDKPGQSYDIGKGNKRNNHTVGGAIGGIVVPNQYYNSEYVVTVENVTVNGSITAFSRGGGVVGYIGGYNGSNDYEKSQMTCTVNLTNCINNADITTVCNNEDLTNNGGNGFRTIGGILGTSNQRQGSAVINFTGCQNNGDISGTRVGGMIGDVHVSDNENGGTFNFNGCSNSGKVTVMQVQVSNATTSWSGGGGIFGYVQGDYNYKLNITNCTNSGEIVDESGFAGRAFLGTIIGGADDSSNVTLVMSGNTNTSAFTADSDRNNNKLTGSSNGQKIRTFLFSSDN